jgi:hypothetical protein
MQATIVLTFHHSVTDALGAAENAAAHLRETFNDDGSIGAAEAVAGGLPDLYVEDVQLAVAAIEAQVALLPVGSTDALRLQGIADDLMLWALGAAGSAA